MVSSGRWSLLGVCRTSNTDTQRDAASHFEQSTAQRGVVATSQHSGEKTDSSHTGTLPTTHEIVPFQKKSYLT